MYAVTELLSPLYHDGGAICRRQKAIEMEYVVDEVGGVVKGRGNVLPRRFELPRMGLSMVPPSHLYNLTHPPLLHFYFIVIVFRGGN